jgi:hypothetical protein
MRKLRVRRNVAAVAVLGMHLALATNASAKVTKGPVNIRFVGARSIRLKVYMGVGLPCDSSINERVVDAIVDPGFEYHGIHGSRSACVQQTFDASSVDWTEPRLVTRPPGQMADGSFKALDLEFSSEKEKS